LKSSFSFSKSPHGPDCGGAEVAGPQTGDGHEHEPFRPTPAFFATLGNAAGSFLELGSVKFPAACNINTL
jgi:hypothetical protein